MGSTEDLCSTEDLGSTEDSQGTPFMPYGDVYRCIISHNKSLYPENFKLFNIFAIECKIE